MSDVLHLYGFVGFDRSARVRWTAKELGLTIEEHRLDARAGEHRGDAYRAVNPTGLVPAVVRDGVTQFDSAAICLHLAETQRTPPLAVYEGEAGRGEFLSWYFFGASTFDAATYPVMLYKMFQPDPAMLDVSMQKLMPHLAVLDRRLIGRDFVCDRFGVADVLIGHGLALQRRCGVNHAEYPAVAAYLDRLAARPAARDLFAA